jgi:hypothetical protein
MALARVRKKRVAGATQIASVLQASAFRGDVTAFRLDARRWPYFGSEPAFRRNAAARVYLTEAAHNPEARGSGSAPVDAFPEPSTGEC